MTDLTAKIAAIREALEGVTPGPWFQTGSPWFRGGDGVIAGSPDGNIGYLIVDTDDWGAPRDDYTGPFELGDKEADAAYLSRLDPQTVAAILDRYERMEMALKPFADAADGLEDDDEDRWAIWERPEAMNITVGDLRNAHKALGDDHG